MAASDKPQGTLFQCIYNLRDDLGYQSAIVKSKHCQKFKKVGSTSSLFLQQFYALFISSDHNVIIHIIVKLFSRKLIKLIVTILTEHLTHSRFSVNAIMKSNHTEYGSFLHQWSVLL